MRISRAIYVPVGLIVVLPAFFVAGRLGEFMLVAFAALCALAL